MSDMAQRLCLDYLYRVHRANKLPVCTRPFAAVTDMSLTCPVTHAASPRHATTAAPPVMKNNMVVFSVAAERTDHTGSFLLSAILHFLAIA